MILADYIIGNIDNQGEPVKREIGEAFISCIFINKYGELKGLTKIVTCDKFPEIGVVDALGGYGKIIQFVKNGKILYKRIP